MINGNKFYHMVKNFKRSLRPGDKFLLSNKEERLGIKVDEIGANFRDFTVYALYPNCVELHHKPRRALDGFIFRYCPSYTTLFLYAAEDGCIIPENYDDEAVATIDNLPVCVGVPKGANRGAYKH